MPKTNFLLKHAFIGLFVVSSPTVAQTNENPSDGIEPGLSSNMDIGWISPEFSSNSVPTVANQMLAFAKNCIEKNTATTKAKLKAIGIDASHLPPGSYGDRSCFLASHYADFPIPSNISADDGRYSVDVSNSLKDFYEAGARRAFALAARDTPKIDQKVQDLISLPRDAQLLRMALSAVNNSRAPILNDFIRALARAQLWADIDAVDQANTEKLKQLLQQEGWPTISIWGKSGSEAAWLIAQHADQDPVFQVTALKQMERLLKSQEVDKSNYAYLYDRTMLKITGKQKFGTQFGECVSGMRELEPLEGRIEDLDHLRNQYSLPTISEYRKLMDRGAQPCAK